MEKNNVILVGMPAVGKSTVGVLLAKRLGYSFLDTDLYIQTREGMKLDAIIEKNGLEGFCAIEEQSVLTLREDRCVIATGGSVIYGGKAMEHLSAMGTIVYLDVAPRVLIDRIGDLAKRGVVIGPGMSIESLYQERHPLYKAAADTVIACDTLSPGELVESIVAALAE